MVGYCLSPTPLEPATKSPLAHLLHHVSKQFADVNAGLRLCSRSMGRSVSSPRSGVCGFWMVCDPALIPSPIEGYSHTHLTSIALHWLPRADFSKVGWAREIFTPQQCMMGCANRTPLCCFVWDHNGWLRTKHYSQVSARPRVKHWTGCREMGKASLLIASLSLTLEASGWSLRS